ncbi:MAG TPA: dihydrofolate reductase family protein [Ktedonobacteraceae bacterium]|nr:dihydrofolate reductase family protein [Ktedonobacteraceae bacterium]
MRKVVASPFTSLDGFMSGLNGEIDWNTPYFDEEMAGLVHEILGDTDTLLFGRVTYEWFAQFWPNEGVQADPGHAGTMNSLPKIVFSKTLEKAEWNNSRIVRDNIVEEITRLKQEEGKNLVIDGSPGLIHSFTSLGLIDEFRIRLHPVVLGSGVPLFKQGLKLKLLEARPMRSGVIFLRYQTEK